MTGSVAKLPWGSEKPRIWVLGVLAGRYRGQAERRRTVTHAWIEDAPKTLCGKIDADALVDVYGAEPPGSVPSCAACAKRLAALGETK